MLIDDPITDRLKALWQQYNLMKDNLVEARQYSEEYDDLDTMYAYVSFRTQELREKFETNIESINNC